MKPLENYCRLKTYKSPKFLCFLMFETFFPVNVFQRVKCYESSAKIVDCSSDVRCDFLFLTHIGLD